ncbi:hypothetical protein GDO86_020280, partial [Hymenochirus boettgeri]
VAFVSFLLVDNGATAVVQAMRIAPWRRNRGIYSMIQQFIARNLQSNHPEVTQVQFKLFVSPQPSQLAKYELLHSKAVVSVVLPNDQLVDSMKMIRRRVEGSFSGTPPDVLGSSEVLNLFEDPNTTKCLLPKGLLVQSILPLTTHKSNLELLLQQGVIWLYSKPEDYIASSRFLSLGTPLFTVPLAEHMYQLEIDLFGTDPSLAQTHVLHQLRAAVRSLPLGGSIVCRLSTEMCLQETIENLWKGMTLFHNYTEYVLQRASPPSGKTGIRHKM